MTKLGGAPPPLAATWPTPSSFVTAATWPTPPSFVTGPIPSAPAAEAPNGRRSTRRPSASAPSVKVSVTSREHACESNMGGSGASCPRRAAAEAAAVAADGGNSAIVTAAMVEKALVVAAAEKAVGVASMVIASSAAIPLLFEAMPLPPPKPPPRGACWLLAPAAALGTGAHAYPFLGRAPCWAPSKPIAPATASSTAAYSRSSQVASRPPARTIASRTDVVVAASSVKLDMAHVLSRTLSCTSSCKARAASSRTSTNRLLAWASSASSLSRSPAMASLRSRMAMLDASSSATASAPPGAFTEGAFTAGTTTRAVATSTSMAPTTAPDVHSLVARCWRPPRRLSVEAGRMAEAPTTAPLIASPLAP